MTVGLIRFEQFEVDLRSGELCKDCSCSGITHVWQVGSSAMASAISTEMSGSKNACGDVAQ